MNKSEGDALHAVLQTDPQVDTGGRFCPAASQLLCSWKLPRCPLNPGKVAKPSHRVGGVQQVAQAYLRRVDLCRGEVL
ncbi:unnamed protein product [Leuciscus chuanchicus]